MDIMTDVAATSVAMSSASLQQGVSLSMHKKVMDTQELAAQEIAAMLPPSSGILDVYA